MSVFTENLDKLLLKKGETRASLLRNLKLGKNSFVNWETRNTLPNGKTLVKLADYFDVSIDQLIGRKQRERHLSRDGGYKQMNNKYTQTPISEFFEEVLNETDFQNNRKVLIISKFDENGNWSAFNCVLDDEDNRIAYGGHIGLCNANGESYLTLSDLLHWLERFRVNGIKVIIDEYWYLNIG